jgi:preprotein translocase subunit SecD
MKSKYLNLALIFVILAAAIWVVSPNSGIQIGSFTRSLKTIYGLDLQGGMNVLLEVDLPAGQVADAQQMTDTRQILQNRVDGSGLTEATVQVAGNSRFIIEIPGATNVEQVISMLKTTGQLEFVDMGDTPLGAGTVIKTNLNTSSSSGTTPTVVPTEIPTVVPTSTDPAATPAPTATTAPEDKVWNTIMTGDQLKTVGVTTDQTGKVVIQFSLKEAGAATFADYTTNNVGKYLAIVLDKTIISAPRIDSAINKGEGIIQGSFTVDSANALAVQLRYGSLPIALKVAESRVVGPTLGKDSLNKSMVAGIVGFIIVVLFMLIFYRLAGGVAILAIASYAVITLALYKLLPVTLTLPGIAGFLLSTGGALDANILIFERLKEELRSGRNLLQAVDLGWKRAWPSIRDSNIATLITSAILFWFGSSFGATIVKGFAITLALGVVISLLSSIFITRTFLNIILIFVSPKISRKWFGA